ncbi:stomatin family protein, partial [Kipferlia bialata]|eukprot:g13143.t1
MSLDTFDYVGIASLVTVLFICICVLISSSFVVVKNRSCVVVERFGRFSHLLQPGLHFLTPWVDRIRPLVWRNYTYELSRAGATLHIDQKNESHIDLRENILDLPLQVVITRDNVAINIHPMILYHIASPLRAVYEICDLSQAVEKLVQTTLRAIVGSMGLDDTLASREEINRALMQKIANVCINWGIELHKVELLEINPMKDIMRAMHEQLKAERQRRANIIAAHGYREVAKTSVEGQAQAQLALATGQARRRVITSSAMAQSKLEVMRAEAEAVKILAEALEPFGIEPALYNLALK